MITGLSLQALAARVSELDGIKRDYIVPRGRLSALVDGPDGVKIDMEKDGQSTRFAPTEHARRQLLSALAIPQTYADLLAAEQSELLETNLNERLRHNPQARHTLRTYHDTDIYPGRGMPLRAVLSDRYRPLDNYDLLAGIGGLLASGSGLSVRSSQVTETRLYIQAVKTGIEVPVHKPDTHDISDVLCPGIVISNSEVGAGSLRVECLMFRRACSNGSMWGDSIRRNHVGKRAQFGDDNAQEIDYSDDTRRKIDEAFWARVRETMLAAMDETRFRAAVARLEPLCGLALDNPQEAVEITAKRHGLTEEEKNAVMRNLIQGADCTAYGLWNAVTHVAEEIECYDRAIEIERIGGALITEGAKIGKN